MRHPLLLTLQELVTFAQGNTHLMSLLWPAHDWRSVLSALAMQHGSGVGGSNSGSGYAGGSNSTGSQRSASQLPPEPKASCCMVQQVSHCDIVTGAK